MIGKQGSWINNMLRKNLGDYRVAYFIFNNGLPEFLDLDLGRRAPDKAMLQNMLEDLMIWRASLLQSILDHQRHPDMQIARRLSSLDHKVWQKQRRERLWEAKRQMAQGARLQKQRDSGKRTADNMSATEQPVLEDFETKRTERRYSEAVVKKMPRFQGKML